MFYFKCVLKKTFFCGCLFIFWNRSSFLPPFLGWVVVKKAEAIINHRSPEDIQHLPANSEELRFLDL